MGKGVPEDPKGPRARSARAKNFGVVAAEVLNDAGLNKRPVSSRTATRARSSNYINCIVNDLLVRVKDSPRMRFKGRRVGGSRVIRSV